MTKEKDTTILRRLVDGVKLMSVEPIVFFCLFGYIVRGVSFQSLLMDRACRNILDHPDDICDYIDDYPVEQAQSIQGGNNLYTGWMLLTSLPAMVVAIFLGPWSDKYSRRYPLILSVAGMLLESTSAAVLTIFPHTSPWLYVAAAFFSGVTGGFVMSLSASFSYLSDITDQRSRPSRFAVLEFFNIIAMVMGNVVGGQVYAAYGYLSVMCIAPCSFLCALLYAIFYLKDTKPSVLPGKRFEMLRDLVSLDNIKQSYHTCTRARPGNMRLQIWLLVWVSCSYKLAEMGIMGIGFPFARKMYKWGVTAYSNANIFFSLSKAAMTIVGIPLLSAKLRLHEAAIGLVGILAAISKLVILSVAYKEFLFYFAFVSGTLSAASAIAVKSRVSKLVHKDELGRAFSFLAIFESLTPLFGTVLFLQIYNASVETFPGLAFAATALFLLPCAVIFTWMMGMPTVSLGEYGRDDAKVARPLEDMSSSSNYNKLEEEKY